MVVTLGLSKACAAAGCAIVVPSAELAQRIFSCGSTLVFSGPLQPAQLGAGIASARILLSDELPSLQRDVEERIKAFDAYAIREGFSARAPGTSPIRYVEVGNEQGTIELATSLQAAGYFVNVAIAPAVPRSKAGVRIMLTRHQTLDDIRELTREIGKKARRETSKSASSLQAVRS
jgi:7-keto-8-aminopelargonate synthetase-like enzyme